MRTPPYFFFFNDTATTEIYTLSLHDALPISGSRRKEAAGSTDGRCAGTTGGRVAGGNARAPRQRRSEEHTSELQSQSNLVCRLLLEKKKQLKHTRAFQSRPLRRPVEVDDTAL